jgi:hypothetical protein
LIFAVSLPAGFIAGRSLARSTKGCFQPRHTTTPFASTT